MAKFPTNARIVKEVIIVKEIVLVKEVKIVKELKTVKEVKIVEHKTCDILAAEWLRLMRFDNRLIIDSFQSWTVQMTD